MNTVFSDFLKEVFEIVIPRSMAKENPRFEFQCGRQVFKPGQMRTVQLGQGSAIRSPQLFQRRVDQLAIVIAADGHIVLAYQRVRRRGSLQRTRQRVSRIHDQIRRVLFKVRLDRLESAYVAVNVGENRDSHHA
jgi:hypothetical protein